MNEVTLPSFVYGGLRIRKLQFLIKFFSNFWSSKPWIWIRIRIRVRIPNDPLHERTSLRLQAPTKKKMQTLVIIYNVASLYTACSLG